MLVRQLLDEPLTAGLQTGFREEAARCRRPRQGTVQEPTPTALRPALREFEQRRADAATAKNFRDQELIEPGPLAHGKLARIRYMYETGEITVNQGEIEIGPQVGNDVPEAPQGGTIWRRRWKATRSQQRHHRGKIGPPAPPDVKPHITHVIFLAQIHRGAVAALRRGR